MARRKYNPFLYPASLNCLIIMGIITVFLYAGSCASLFFVLLPIHIHGRAGGVIYIIALGYFFMYLNECVFDSAKGGLMAPDTKPGGTGFQELAEELSWGILPLIICFGPSLLYLGFVNNPERVIYLSIIGAGLFFYPMMYLRSIMMREASAFNPFAVVYNIVRFLPGYISLLAGTALVFIPIALTYITTGSAAAATIVSVPWFVYSSVVMAHLVGRFYCLRSDKLEWQ